MNGEVVIIGETIEDAQERRREWHTTIPELFTARALSASMMTHAAEGLRVHRVYVTSSAPRGPRFYPIAETLQRNMMKTRGADLGFVTLSERRS